MITVTFFMLEQIKGQELFYTFKVKDLIKCKIERSDKFLDQKI